MMVINYLMMMIFILLGVAFFTLLERKVWGYIHYRLGPNKVGFLGIFQPFSDAMKLFMKSNIKLMNLNYLLYMISPSLGIFLMMILWGIFPFWGNIFYSKYSLILFMVISGLTIYFLLGTGWTSFSKYSLMGSYRSVAQAISYEVSMFLVVFCYSWFIGSYNLMMYNNFQFFNCYCFWFLPLIYIWLLICLAESNRTPFDFSEGESELVSGFNTEYGGGYFSLIFISEYGSIIFFSYITSMLFLGGSNFIMMKAFIFSYIFIWIRGSYPRLRYDRLMMMAWKSILPIVLGLLFFYFNFSIF